MKEYLVQSHLGGLYISDADPESIMAICEQCFDQDWIVGEWEKGDPQETEIKIDYILSYIYSDMLYLPDDPLTYALEVAPIEPNTTIEEITSYLLQDLPYIKKDLEQGTLIHQLTQEENQKILTELEQLEKDTIEKVKDWGIYPYDENRFYNAIKETNALQQYYGGQAFTNQTPEGIDNFLSVFVIEDMGNDDEELVFPSPYREVLLRAIDEKLPGFLDAYKAYWEKKTCHK